MKPKVFYKPLVFSFLEVLVAVVLVINGNTFLYKYAKDIISVVLVIIGG